MNYSFEFRRVVKEAQRRKIVQLFYVELWLLPREGLFHVER
jgi:hypothetical protein